jgi:hypothetical protein
MSGAAPLRLFTWTFRHPGYREDVVLDCAAPDINAAFQSALRFIDRENTRLRRIGKVAGRWVRIRPPRHASNLREEGNQ